jgi:hypothetical protein
VSVTILNVDPGGWSSESGSPARGLHRDDAGAVAAAEQAGGERLQRRRDRRADVAAALRRDRREHAVARVERPAGATAQLMLEDRFEAVEPDGRRAWQASGLDVGELRTGRGPDGPDDVRRRGDVAQRPAVACEEHTSAGQVDRAMQALARGETREEQRGAPAHARVVAGVGDRHREALVEGAEHPRSDPHRHDVALPVRLGRRAAGTRALDGRGGRRPALERDEMRA